MAKTYYNTTRHEDQIVDFNYMGRDYQWEGDYEVLEEGEADNDNYLGWSEKSVEIVHTQSLAKWASDLDQWIEIKPTHSVLTALELHIESEL
jgi:hypothetical protein